MTLNLEIVLYKIIRDLKKCEKLLNSMETILAKNTEDMNYAEAQFIKKLRNVAHTLNDLALRID